MDKLVPDNNGELLERLQQATTEMLEEIDKIIEDDANFNPVENEWSVKEVLCHLRDAENISTHRLQQILEEDEPFLRAFNPDELAIERDYKSDAWEQVRAAFAQARQTNINLLNELRPVQWLKGGIHQERGHMTIHDLAEALHSHTVTHLEQIRHARWLAK